MIYTIKSRPASNGRQTVHIIETNNLEYWTSQHRPLDANDTGIIKITREEAADILKIARSLDGYTIERSK